MFDIIKIITLLDSVVSILVGGIALYVYFFKRKYIASLIHILLNFSVQDSITELKIKLDNLNYFNADSNEHRSKVIYIFGDIEGILKGNPILASEFRDIIQILSGYMDNPNSLKETKKRSLISETRGRLDNINIINYVKLLGDKHE